MVATLYYTPSSCGFASYMVAKKSGALAAGSVVAILVNIQTHIIEAGPQKGESFYKVNPKGNVPTLVLADGTLLNEGAAVLQFLGDQEASKSLAPAAGSSARYLVQSKLNWTASELHARCAPLFNPSLTPEIKAYVTANFHKCLTYLETVELQGGKHYLVGDHFTIADAYCYVVLSWSPYIGTDLTKYPLAKAYHDNIASLDFVKECYADHAAK